MKIAVIYDSKTGNTKQAAKWIVEGMDQTEGVEAQAFSIQEMDEVFVKEACGIVVGSPSYAALMTPDMHAWLLSLRRETGTLPGSSVARLPRSSSRMAAEKPSFNRSSPLKW